jgi:hypothetical protein
MKRRSLLVFILALSVITFNACKKDQDTIPPVIVINSPAPNQAYHVFDTVPLNLNVSDDKQLQSPVSITLLDANGNAAMSSASVSVNTNPIHIVGGFPLSEIHLLSGNYTLKVTASDGRNVTNAFVPLNITAAPILRKGIYLISRGGGQVKISKVDTNFVITPYTSWQGDYGGSDISSYWQQLYVSGLYTGNFNAVNLTNASISWSEPVVIGSNPWFCGAYVGGNNVYIPYFNGFVRGYDHLGVLQFSSATQSSYHPGKMLATGNYFLDEQIYVTNLSSKLVVNNISSGVGLQEMLLTQRLVQYCVKDADNVFLFGNNSAGQGQVELYTISLNGSWSPHPIPTGTILGVSQVDADHYLIALSDGNIYKYQYSVNSITAYLPGVNASNVFYDGLKNEVLISSVNRLSTYDYNSMALKHTVLHTDTILNFHLLNNK